MRRGGFPSGVVSAGFGCAGRGTWVPHEPAGLEPSRECPGLPLSPGAGGRTAPPGAGGVRATTAARTPALSLGADPQPRGREAPRGCRAAAAAVSAAGECPAGLGKRRLGVGLGGGLLGFQSRTREGSWKRTFNRNWVRDGAHLPPSIREIEAGGSRVLDRKTAPPKGGAGIGKMV